MGLLDNTTHLEYYQGNDYGNYQFVSLDDIITQFQIMYVGEDKLIPKAKRADIAFHAQRALAELSFDTFKSFKSQQIDVPPSLTMILPHDYVNYTKVSWADSAGIKRPIYHTRHTSNPFQVKQEDSGEYSFGGGLLQLVQNFSFDDPLTPEGPWNFTDHFQEIPYSNMGSAFNGSFVSLSDGSLVFRNASHRAKNTATGVDDIYGVAQAVWQQLDVTNIDVLSITSTATSVAAGTQTAANGTTYNTPITTVRVGISPSPGNMSVVSANEGGTLGESPNLSTDIFLGNQGQWLEWTNGATGEQVSDNIDVSMYDTVYVLAVSIAPWVTWSSTYGELFVNTSIASIEVQANTGSMNLVSPEGNEINSSTWNAYSSNVPSEDYIQDYRYEQHWLNPNERYGLHPEHAQINGSFYIDDRLGRIHFSSNISGKTVILDYISDSLGTDAEMQVPKLAEDAMYKHILYDVISTRSNIGGGRLSFHKREKFAAVRKAKLRLSNIKLEELTQILRGQSKIIKH